MTDYLALIDAADFSTLFIRELGWSTPRRARSHRYVGEREYRMNEVAEFKGLAVWVCDDLPSPQEQRRIDNDLAKVSAERLLIFCGAQAQDWRWPRRGRLGSVSNKLMLHRHQVGTPDPDLLERVQSMYIDIDEDPSLVELLSRMRTVFDQESETASAKAARLMGSLYEDLDQAGMATSHSTQMLARLLFLWFGDDAGMWAKDTFQNWLAEHTTDDNLSDKLVELFRVVDNPAADNALDGREWTLPEEFRGFRYINGGLFAHNLALPTLPADFRSKVMEACAFDWSIISPAIFGSMFQTVKDSKARRAMGEHYTTETNILRTLRPLFLDELEERFERAKDSKAELTKLHNHLGTIQVMDPACGCGNFLIVAYRELRALEHQIIARRRELDRLDGTYKKDNEARFQFDGFEDTKIRMSNFAGIEIEDWPAAIAETAMLLVDHQANQDMADEVGQAMVRLPIDQMNRARIIHGNALRRDWAQILEPTANTYIVGNPPFIGQYTKTKEQTEDTKHVWGDLYDGYLDYVTCWYKKASDYFEDVPGGRFAFVSTNSIAQGQPVPALFKPLFDAGWRIRFAHQTFPWSSEATDKAAVHCVIIGFDKHEARHALLFSYPDFGGTPVVRETNNVNGYLLEGPSIFVDKRSEPISHEIMPVHRGSQPTDGGNLLVEPDELTKVISDPIAARYVRPFRMGKESVQGLERWCLWMAVEDFNPADLQRSPVLNERITAVREMRLASKKEPTRRSAETPHLFQEDRQPDVAYVGIPRVVSEGRRYFTTDYLSPEIIAGDKVYTAVDPDGFLFCIFSSSMFITWQRAIGGRLKSDLSFSNTIVWNNLPLPPVDAELRQQIIEAAKGVLAARELYPERSLAEHYKPDNMDPALLAAHDALDILVDRAFGATEPCASNDERLAILFQRYLEMTGE